MLSTATRDALPIFPLPRTVLMPGAVLPLHIFEPRYQQLLKTIMAGDRLMGMGTLKVGGLEIHEPVGVGRVARVEPRPDGCSDIVLVHVATVWVERECEQVEAFRRFKTYELPEVEADVQEVAACRSLLFQLAVGTRGLEEDAYRIAELEGMDLVHAVARRLYQDPERRLTYLAATEQERVRRVRDDLASLYARSPSVADA